LEAGADLVFVTGVSTLEDMGVLVKGIKGPVSIPALPESSPSQVTWRKHQ